MIIGLSIILTVFVLFAFLDWLINRDYYNTNFTDFSYVKFVLRDCTIKSLDRILREHYKKEVKAEIKAMRDFGIAVEKTCKNTEKCGKIIYRNIHYRR